MSVPLLPGYPTVPSPVPEYCRLQTVSQLNLLRVKSAKRHHGVQRFAPTKGTRQKRHPSKTYTLPCGRETAAYSGVQIEVLRKGTSILASLSQAACGDKVHGGFIAVLKLLGVDGNASASASRSV